MRGEPTGPLPTPNPTPKRRYEATPSAVTHRPLAPHTDMEHAEDGRLAHNKKASATMSPPAQSQVRAAPDIAPDRTLSRYPPLAQATGAPPSTGAIMPDDPLRNMRQSGAHPAPPRTFTGPRMGYFTEDRREARAPSAASRAPELQPSPRVAPSTQGPDVSRLEPLPQQLRPRRDFHAQPMVYMQPQPTAMSGSHSRHPSLTGSTAAPGSPAQSLQQKHTPEVSPIRRSSFGQGYYPYPSSNIHPKTTVSPVKEAPAPPPPPPQEPPRQVPAKRSNIMSILNDEPEELPPRKRFASEMASPRTTYGQPELPGPATSNLRHEEKAPYFPHAQQQQQQQSSHGPPPGRSYSNYSSYQQPPLGSSSAASGPPSHDWIVRFDPRSQSQQSAEPIRPTPTPAPPAQYGGSGAGYQPASNSQTPTPQGNPPPSSGHRGYQGYPPPHGQSASTPALLASNARESSSSAYRHQNAASPPPPHQSVLSYGPRPVQSPAQSPATPLNIPPPRQSSGAGPSSYSSTHSQGSSPHPLASQHRSTHSGHQSYQQHVQALVNGQQPPPAPSRGIAGGPPNSASPYISPAPLPPSQQQPQPYRPGSSLPNLRPYTPPPASHGPPPPPAPTLGGIPYPGGNGAAAGHVHHTPYPHPHESHGGPSASAHHRVYSQGGSASSSR